MIPSLKHLFAVDLRSLALMRIAMAVLLIADLIGRSFDLSAHYTDFGALPRKNFGFIEAMSGNPWWFISFHLSSGTWQFEALLMLIAGVIAVLLLVGYRTRWVTFVSWLFLSSLQSRNFMILQAGDILLRVVLFWAMFLPWGARFSIDALLGDGNKKTPRIFSAATVAYLLQIVFVYVFSAVLKSGPEWRTEGTAIYYALSVDQFTTSFGYFLLKFPFLLKGLTFGVYWLELLGIFFIFSPVLTGPLRTFTVFCFWGLHLGLAMSMELGNFPWISSMCMLGILPTWFWDKLLPRTGTSSIEAASDLSIPVNTGLSFLLVYVFLWNMGTIKNSSFLGIPTGLKWVGFLSRLSQQWDMFAPFPIKEDGWYVIPGELKDGTVVDVFRNGGDVRWEKPERVANAYKNFRWRKYMMNLWNKNYASHRLFYSRYLCRDWNSRHPQTKQLAKFQLIFMLERTLPDYQVSPPQKTVLFSYDCGMEADVLGKIEALLGE